MAETGTSRSVSGGPGRRVVITALVAALGIGVVAGAIFGVIDHPDAPKGSVVTPAQTTGAPGEGSQVGTASASGSVSPSAATPSVATSTLTSQAAPQTYIEQPWTQPSLEFVYLQDVQQNDSGVTITVGRAKLTRHQQTGDGHGGQQNEFTVKPSGSKRWQFLVREDATVFGEYNLTDHSNVQRRQLTVNDFARQAQDALAHGASPTVWIQHSNGISTAPAIYVAEQYVPSPQQ